MLNKVILVGRLCSDPELRFTSSGTAVTNITLAVQRDFKNSQGENETDFISVAFWRKTAEAVSKTLQKGRLIACEGRIVVNKWKDDNGNNRTKFEVHAGWFWYLDKSNQPKEVEDHEFGSGEESTKDDLPF